MIHLNNVGFKVWKIDAKVVSVNNDFDLFMVILGNH